MSSPNTRKTVAYQIDFTAVASGKRIASSKRRVRWRFGFANPEALASGQTGTACRGEEHDVTFVWSITSGKRIILADGQEVHFSSSRSSTFDFSWTMRGNHVLKISAHANPPVSPTPGFRQYDFCVDGQSFFSFPKLFRLGLSAGDPTVASPYGHPQSTQLAETSRRYRPGGKRSGSSDGIASIEAPHNPDEEELYLQEAIRQSLTDNAPQTAPATAVKAKDEPVPPPQADLLDFGASSAPPVPPPASNPYENRVSSWGGGFTVSDLGSQTSAPNDVHFSSTQNNPGTNINPYGHNYNAGFGSNDTPITTLVPSATQPSATQPSATQPYAPSTDSTLGALVPSTTPSSIYGSTVSSNPYGPSYQSAGPSTATPNPFAGTGSMSSNPYASQYNAPVSVPVSNASFNTGTDSASTNPYAMPTSQFGVSAQAASLNPTFPASSSASNPYSAATTSSSNPYSAAMPSNPYAEPSVPQGNPYGNQVPSGIPPTPIVTNLYGSQNMIAESSIPPSITPKAQQTPSTIGFGSPAAEFSFSSPTPNKYQEPIERHEVEASQQNNNLAYDSFGSQNQDATSGGGALGGLDQAFSKLVNLDTFSMGSKKDDVRSNPFEKSSINSTVGGSRSLADLQKSKPPPRTDIMKTPAPGALVVSSNQNQPYASQYGIQQGMQQQSYGSGAQYGAQAQYGGPMQQQFGVAPIQPPNMMQNQFGQAPPMQPQSNFGQQPPVQSQLQFPQQPPMMQGGQVAYGQQPPMMQGQMSYGQNQPTMPPLQTQFGAPQQQYSQAPAQQQQGFY